MDMSTPNPKRIDPAAVAAWFRAHPEIAPTMGAFVRFLGDRPSHCCVLTSLVLAAEVRTFDLHDLREMSTTTGASRIAFVLGYSPSYAYGLANGWDGCLVRWGDILEYDPGEYEAGRRDGIAAWDATREALS
jgi:hypothetical protein